MEGAVTSKKVTFNCNVKTESEPVRKEPGKSVPGRGNMMCKGLVLEE